MLSCMTIVPGIGKALPKKHIGRAGPVSSPRPVFHGLNTAKLSGRNRGVVVREVIGRTASSGSNRVELSMR